MVMKEGRVRTMYITWNVAGIEPSALPCSSMCEEVNNMRDLRGQFDITLIDGRGCCQGVPMQKMSPD